MAAHSLVHVTVKNIGSEPIWVSIDNVKIELQEISESESTSQSTSNSSSFGLGVSQAASVEIPGVGGASSERSGNISGSSANSQSSASSNASSRKFALSSFIEAGESRIAPGGSARIGVDSDTYYLSVRTERMILSVNARKVTKDNLGIWIAGEDINFVGPTINSGDQINLTHEHTHKSLAEPIHTHNMWNVAQGKDSAQPHRIEKVSGGGGIRNGDIVRIVAVRPLDTDRKYLFHGHNDNTFYEWNKDDRATHWRVGITSQEDDTTNLRDGSQIQLTGVAWNKMLTIDSKPDMNWVKAMAVRGAATHWTIS